MDTIILKKKKYVLVPEEEYRRMVEGVPPLPPRDARGNYPALAACEASIARSIVRRREAAGLTQRELADAAGVRVEVLNRAERGTVTPSVRTLIKIEAAFTAAGSGRKR